MSEKTTKILTIALSGWREDKLKSFFRLECDGAYEIVSEGADVLIADLDNYKDRARMLEFTAENPNIPAIFLSFDDTFSQCPHLEHPFLIKKPYELSEIKAQLVAATSQSDLPNAKSENASTLGRGKSEKRIAVAIEKAEAAMKKATATQAAAATIAVTAVTAVTEATVSEEEEAVGAAESAIMAVAAIEAAEDAAAEAEIAAALAEIAQEAVETTIALSGSKANLPHTDINEDFSFEGSTLSEKAYYDPDKFLYGHLANISKTDSQQENGAKLVTLIVGQAIFVYSPNKKSIKVNIGGSKLQALASLPLYEKSVELTTLDTSWDDIEGEQYAVKELLWDTATWAARGRVAVGTDLTKPVALIRWPNMTRLREFPHAARVAALWIKRPTSLINTAKILEVPRQDVFGFYTATKAIGLSYHTEENDNDGPPDTDMPIQNTPKLGGLFSRILKHLKG